MTNEGMTMRLRDEFALTFAGQEVTTKVALEWYNSKALEKGNKPTTHRSNIYSLIIHPLINEGRIVKMTHGIFYVCDFSASADTDADNNEEFDRYLQSKLEKCD